MWIHSLKISSPSDWGDRISAVVGDENVWFDIKGSPTLLRFSYDPFVIAAIVQAMESGEDLNVAEDAPLSPALLENLNTAILIYNQWWPELTPVRIFAPRLETGEPAKSNLTGCFFSGGVDSAYSLISHMQEITHLILCRGLDIPANEVSRWERTVESVQATASKYGKSIILVDTNVNDVLGKPTRAAYHGAILISTGMAMGFRKLIIPSSHSYNYLPRWGSHPMLDPLFGNEVTEVIHDNLLPRSDKTKLIIEANFDIGNLRVCNVYTKYNCGKCEKCLRTRTMLTMLNTSTGSLAPVSDLKELRNVRIYRDSEYKSWTEILIYSRDAGRKDIEIEAERILRKYRIKQALQSLDQDLFNGTLRKLKLLLK